MPMAMRAFILMCCWGPGAHALTLPSYRSAQGDYLNGKASDAQAGLLPNLSTREMAMNAKVPSGLNFSRVLKPRVRVNARATMLWRSASDHSYPTGKPNVESSMMFLTEWITGMSAKWMSYLDPSIEPITDLKCNVTEGHATRLPGPEAKPWNGGKPALNGIDFGLSTNDHYKTYQAIDKIAPTQTPATAYLGIQAPVDWAGIYMAAAFGLSSNRITAIFLLILRGAEAVTCTHCKDSISGCTGGADCPLVKDMAGNALIFANKVLDKTPKLFHMITTELATHFSRPVCEAIVGLACAPAQGHEVDFSSATYSTCHAVVQSALYGHCSVTEASAVLSSRLEACTTDVEISRIRAAMETLKLNQESVATATSGLMTFLWTKITNVVAKRSDGVARLDVGKGKAGALSVTLVRPSNDSEFYEMLHLFTMVMIALGLATSSVVLKFLDDVVWGAIRMKESFQVAHELLLLYLRELDLDAFGTVNIANVFRRGGQDTLLTEARRNASAFFRTRAGTARLGGAEDKKDDVKSNGKFSESSTKPCLDFNAGRPCKKLKADGTCQFNHKCSQWVSDKGKNGVCFADHARCNGCDYDESKKLKQASKD